MVNSWLMRDSLDWGLGGLHLGAWDPPKPLGRKVALCSILSIRVAASGHPELVSTREARGGYSYRSTRKLPLNHN